ncbi:MAG: acetolactate synthase large subunit [Methanomassiliicoccales archaeon]|nr:acetolactate synthase large subunit [Methanomassiliicoccales archaeon]
MRGSDLLVKCLEDEGVTRIFGIPGEENLDLMDSLIDSGIEFVLTKHEESAAFMAEISARLSGKPGVCLSTLGPGATNLVTGIADAYLCYTPVVALTGQVRTERAHPPEKQYIDLVQLFKPITKESFSIRTPSKIPLLTRRAFDKAKEERPGPVHVELPEDIMRCEVEGRPLPRSASRRTSCDLSSLEPLKKAISEAGTPLVLAGIGVIRSGSQEALRKFSAAWNLPVVHTWLASGILPFDDPRSLHSVGRRTHDFMRKAFEEADLVIAVGYDVIEYQPVFWNIGREKKVFHVGPVPAETVDRFSPHVQLIGDINSILSGMTKGAEDKGNWAGGLRDQLHEMMTIEAEDTAPIKPQLAVRAVRNSLGRKDIAVCDVGAHLIWMEKLYPTYAENTLVVSNGLIGMGIGVPGAIASKLTFPERKVVAVVGDGGFMMTSSELETASRMKAPFVSVIFDDRTYGLIKIRQEKNYGRTIGVDFGNPDFVKYAESFGADGYRVSSARELEEVLVKCLRDEALAVIDVPIDYAENVNLAI